MKIKEKKITLVRFAPRLRVQMRRLNPMLGRILETSLVQKDPMGTKSWTGVVMGDWLYTFKWGEG